jgi:membrane fusion protein, multidrug efflux system
VDNPGLSLKPGDYLRVAFETDRKNPPLEIPASALSMRPDGPEVAVVAPDNTVQLRPITIQQDMGSYIEVATGLKEGERVALNVGDAINTGSRIEPNSVDAPVKTADVSTEAGNGQR